MVLQEDVAYLAALERDGADARLPDGRRSPAQRKIHAENVGRVHGGACAARARAGAARGRRPAREAGEGEARLALIEGPAGIGKTRLLRGARGADARACPSLARAAPSSSASSRSGRAPALRAGAVGPNARRGCLSGAAETAGAVFAPVGRIGAGDASFAVLHGLYWLTVNVSAEPPLLLALDDLHWCDRASLRFLAYFARRLEGLPVLVAASLRPAEPGADRRSRPSSPTIPATPLRPGPLGEAAVAELVRERLGDDADHAFAARARGERR